MSTHSEQQRLNTTPLSNSSESLVLLPQRKKRTRPSKLNREEIRYQHFVHDLQKEIHFHMNRCLRESRFDPRGNQSSQTNSTLRTLQATINSRRAPSTIGYHRTYETDTITSSMSNRQDPLALLKHNETKRLAADVRTILAGPAMKNFYSQFIRPKHHPNSLEKYI